MPMPPLSVACGHSRRGFQLLATPGWAREKSLNQSPWLHPSIQSPPSRSERRKVSPLSGQSRLTISILPIIDLWTAFRPVFCSHRSGHRVGFARLRPPVTVYGVCVAHTPRLGRNFRFHSSAPLSKCGRPPLDLGGLQSSPSGGVCDRGSGLFVCGVLCEHRGPRTVCVCALVVFGFYFSSCHVLCLRPHSSHQEAM